MRAKKGLRLTAGDSVIRLSLMVWMMLEKIMLFRATLLALFRENSWLQAPEGQHVERRLPVAITQMISKAVLCGNINKHCHRW